MSTIIKAPIISFKDQDYSFEFTPIDSNFITANQQPLYNYIVIIYQLKIKTSAGTAKANIPYYISDGQTNHLRANMIFPFICINEVNKGRDVCPYSDKWAWGLLYKYNKCTNLEFKKFPNTDYRYDYNDKEAGKYCIELESVMPRLTNLLDFILSLSFSNRIDHNIIMEDIPSFRHIPYYLKKNFNYNYNVKTIAEENDDEDRQRKDILEYLLTFKREINNIKEIIITQDTHVLIRPATIESFNNQYGQVCNDIETFNNLKNYIYISEKFFESFKKLPSNLFTQIISKKPSYTSIKPKSPLTGNEGWNWTGWSESSCANKK